MEATHVKPNFTIFCEIRDEDNSVESCSLVDSTADAILWFREHEIEFAHVTMREPSYTDTIFEYRRAS